MVHSSVCGGGQSCDAERIDQLALPCMHGSVGLLATPILSVGKPSDLSIRLAALSVSAACRPVVPAAW